MTPKLTTWPGELDAWHLRRLYDTQPAREPEGKESTVTLGVYMALNPDRDSYHCPACQVGGGIPGRLLPWSRWRTGARR